MEDKVGSSLLTSKIEELVSDSRKASQTTEKNLRELLTASYSAITDVKASLGKTDEHVSSLKTSAQVHACSHPHCSLTLTVLSSSLSSSCPSTTHTHTITHSHTHSLSLVPVVMIKSKELKTKICHTHSLILSSSLLHFHPHCTLIYAASYFLDLCCRRVLSICNELRLT